MKEFCHVILVKSQRKNHEVHSDFHQQFTMLHRGGLDIHTMIQILDTTGMMCTGQPGLVLLTWLFLVGIVVFLGISFVKTPPSVSIPRDSGVTSNNNTSLTSPARTPPWIAAPTATASSGLTALLGARPKVSCTIDCTCWENTSIYCTVIFSFVMRQIILAFWLVLSHDLSEDG